MPAYPPFPPWPCACCRRPLGFTRMWPRHRGMRHEHAFDDHHRTVAARRRDAARTGALGRRRAPLAAASARERARGVRSAARLRPAGSVGRRPARGVRSGRRFPGGARDVRLRRGTAAMRGAASQGLLIAIQDDDEGGRLAALLQTCRLYCPTAGFPRVQRQRPSPSGWRGARVRSSWSPRVRGGQATGPWIRTNSTTARRTATGITSGGTKYSIAALRENPGGAGVCMTIAVLRLCGRSNRRRRGGVFFGFHAPPIRDRGAA